MLSLRISLALLALPPALSAQDAPSWPQFRGPGGLAVAAGEKLPLPFGPGKNQLWKTELPAGHSSPCIWGERIFLTGSEGDQLIMLALDRTDGSVVWRKSVTSRAKLVYQHADSAPAQPTACTDGEHVTFYFGQYGLVTTDFDGEVLWTREMSIPQTGFGTGTSPILVEGMLVLQRDGTAEGALLVLDPATGEELWSIPRIQFGPHFSTPFFWSNSERNELVVSGSGTLSSYDLATGELLWEVGELTQLPCPSVTGDDERLYYAAWSTPNSSGDARLTSIFGDLELTEEERADGKLLFEKLDLDDNGQVTRDELPECRAKDAYTVVDRNGNGTWEVAEYVEMHELPLSPGRNIAVAVRAGGSGDITGSHVVWSARRGIPYVASPLLHDGRVYLAKAGGFLTCLDAETGKAHYDRERFDDRSEYYASPLGVGEHVVVCSSQGSAYVLKSADELEVVHEVELGDEIHATPAVIEGKLYLRTTNAMWAFGSEKP